MNPRRLHQALAMALLLGVASFAAGQTGSSAGGTSAKPPSAATASDGGGMHGAKSGKRHARPRMQHDAASHGSETPYHAALKRCVEGPAGQRESCIDQAISQHGS